MRETSSRRWPSSTRCAGTASGTGEELLRDLRCPPGNPSQRHRPPFPENSRGSPPRSRLPVPELRPLPGPRRRSALPYIPIPWTAFTRPPGPGQIPSVINRRSPRGPIPAAVSRANRSLHRSHRRWRSPGPSGVSLVWKLPRIAHDADLDRFLPALPGLHAQGLADCMVDNYGTAAALLRALPAISLPGAAGLNIFNHAAVEECRPGALACSRSLPSLSRDEIRGLIRKFPREAADRSPPLWSRGVARR